MLQKTNLKVAIPSVFLHYTCRKPLSRESTRTNVQTIIVNTNSNIFFQIENESISPIVSHHQRQNTACNLHLRNLRIQSCNKTG